jgi:pimeloyl-ACP methyl ester carboxylesterase
MRASYLTRGEGRVAYDVQGEGPLVVCLPGMGDLRQIYRFLAPSLVEAGFRVATMDLRGHGDSDDGFSSYDNVAAGLDVLALIEHLGGPALIVSNSLTGGASAEARLAEVHTPVLVIMGDRDPDFADPTAEARFIGEELDAEVLLVPGAGHYPMAEFPEIVNPAIGEFARRVYAGA